MKKLISICLILSLAFLFASCDPNTSIQDSAKDPNVPPASEISKNATEEEIALMKNMMTDYPHYSTEYLVSTDNTTILECLDDAKINGAPASGKLTCELKGTANTFQVTFSGEITMNSVTYKINDVGGTVITNETSYDPKGPITGSIIASDEKEYKNAEALDLAVQLFSSAFGSENIKVTSSVEDTYMIAGTKTKLTLERSGISNDSKNTTEKSYYVIENGSHKMTLGTQKNENKDEFLYLSLDEKYFDESVYEKMISMK